MLDNCAIANPYLSNTGDFASGQVMLTCICVQNVIRIYHVVQEI